MNSEKKSLVEEALLQMKNLENVVSENAKGILASTMKEEIEELVKESLFEGTDEEMMADESYNTEGIHMMDMKEDEDEDSMTIDMTASDDAGDEMSMTDDITMMDDDDMMGDEIEPLNMVGASDEELMKIVMGMGDSDRLIVQKMGDELDVDVLSQTDTMTLPIGGGEEDLSDELSLGSDEDLTDEMTEEVVYEIEISDDDDEDDDEKEGMMESKEKTYVGVGMGKGPGKVSFKGENIHKGPHGKSAPEAKKYVKGEFKEGQGYDDHEDEKEGMEHGALSKKDLKSMKSRRDDAGFETREDEMKEASRTYGNGSRNYPKRDGLPKMKVVTNKALEEEVRVLRLKNEEYRKALNIFREKLNEVAVFNSNLAYATRLFTEHSTTKQEKINIMRRFDNVETIKESKNLYSQIKNELGGKENTVVKESIVESIDRTPTKGSTNLVENKTYENPQFLRMKDLMSKLNK
jgi:hypothetical protein